ncbi:hypothetical protein C5F44_12595 [Fuscovulum blasticum DSM 2131]|uniref:Uncharacterized protein n=1 Tax=Fuscovulum blasticum DSM 2131 TaxID=1188250 RepID=A0A2T4J6Y2_FUSBL|nr:hypothetical protein C5F44_12595 [Fuscovulum blasticum DSM 2131]
MPEPKGFEGMELEARSLRATAAAVNLCDADFLQEFRAVARWGPPWGSRRREIGGQGASADVRPP